MIALIKALGVISKAGLKTFIPLGAIGLLKNNSVSSSGLRSSIGISFPLLILKSKVDLGTAI